jgi:predicted transcriptional regulator
VRKSVTPETVYCLECGKGFKSLKRHIGTEHALSPADYRVRWGLPSDYPMVASAYAEQRSELAKRIGLGNSRRIVAEAPVVEETVGETNGKAPRKRKSKDA